MYRDIDIPPLISEFARKMKLIYNGYNYNNERLIKYMDRDNYCHHFVIVNNKIIHKLRNVKSNKYYARRNEDYKIPSFELGELNGRKVKVKKNEYNGKINYESRTNVRGKP